MYSPQGKLVVLYRVFNAKSPMVTDLDHDSNDTDSETYQQKLETIARLRIQLREARNDLKTSDKVAVTAFRRSKVCGVLCA